MAHPSAAGVAALARRRPASEALDRSEDLAFAGIRELRRRLSAGELTAVELAEYLLARLERLGPQYRAVRTVLRERALAEAARSDRRIGRGPAVSRAGARDVLLGVPYGVKDVFAARGGPTSFGSPALREQVIDSDAFVVEALSDAGGVLTAKLSLTELVTFRGAEMPDDAIDGAARNPWNPGRWTGGSSSGAAAAVAAGLLPFAIGTDSGGSISMPSAYCGITGLRPSWRAVPGTGGLATTDTLDKSGPLARSAADCATVFDALVRRRPAEGRPWTRIAPGRPLDRDGLRALRVGFHSYDFEIAADEDARPPLAAGLRAVLDLGVRQWEIALPPDLAVRGPLRTIALVECASALGQLAASGAADFESDPAERAGFAAARGISGVEYVEALAGQQRIIEAFRDIFGAVDVLVSFTAPSGAPPTDAPFEPIPATGGNTALLYAGILAGLPSLSVPCGLTAAGLPIGLQIVGPRGGDRLVLQLGQAIQAGTDWHRMRPPSIHPGGNVG